MYPLVDVETPNIFSAICFRMMRFQRLRLMTELYRIICRMKSGSLIRHSAMDSSQEHRIPQNRLSHCMTIFINLAVQKGKSVSVNFSYTARKTEMPFYKCMERGYEFPEVTSWIRASKKDFQLVKDIGLKETGILVSCSDYHIFYKLNMTRRQAMEHYLWILEIC